MENLQWRALAALVISLLILLSWNFFTGAPAPKKAPPPPQAQELAQNSTPNAVEQPATTVAPRASALPAPAHPARDIVVTTDLYRAVFTEQGARLKSFQLFKFRETVDKNSPPKELVRTTNPADLPLGVALLKQNLDTSQAVFTASTQQLDLRGQGAKSGDVSFELTTPQGVQLIKRFDFQRDLYRINTAVALRNLGGQPIEAEPSMSLINTPFSTDTSHYKQTAVLVGDEIETTATSKLTEPKLVRGDVRWAAYDQPFFMSALAPAPEKKTVSGETVNVSISSSGDVVRESLISPPRQLLPNQELVYNYAIYYGPKEMNVLKAQGLGLEKIIEYGWFDVIGKPLLVVLNFIDQFTHNYGVAVILLTVLIKVLFWPLSHKSYRSMKEMQRLQPKMAKLREKHKGDTQKLNEEVLNLYRTYKVNPMGGCLPMLAQVPVFFALYRVLQYSIELRHAPFIGWINDLSAPDRLNIGIAIPYLGGLPVLTILMGVSMWMQQKMTPVSGDPSQAKMMQVLPLVFTFMFLYFPSGLVLYWLVNNVLSIGQQYYINHRMA
ncbi:MAG: membrane protein insertase YidC [Pseudomonadota bacterium]